MRKESSVRRSVIMPALETESKPQGNSEKPRRSLLDRPAFWIVTMALLAAVTTARMMKHSPPPFDPLHGGAEDAADSLIEILAKTPVEKRLPLLLQDANDASPGLRYAAIDKLSEYRSQAVAAPLETAFQDSSIMVRMRALESLPDAEPERGFRLLLAALKDEDTQIRADALTQIGSRIHANKLPQPIRAVPALLSLLDSENPGEVIATLFLLHQLTGKPWYVKSNAAPSQRNAAVRHWKQWAQTHPPEMQVAPDLRNVAPRPPTRADPAPEFSLPDLNGKTVSLENQKGRVTLLNFWGTWCGPCQGEIPDLIKIDREFRGQNVDVIGIPLNEDSEKTFRAWIKTHHIEYRQAMGTPEMQRVFSDAHELPITVLIDQNGQMRYRWDGPCDYATFQAAVKRALRQ